MRSGIVLYGRSLKEGRLDLELFLYVGEAKPYKVPVHAIKFAPVMIVYRYPPHRNWDEGLSHL